MARIQISLKDPETRAIWESALEARDEVASWPPWKRGEVLCYSIRGGSANVDIRVSTTPTGSMDISARLSQSGWLCRL